MTKVYTAPSVQFIYHLKNVLENYGIECVVIGENRCIGIGEIPPNECWIELHVVDDKQTVQATDLIHKIVAGDDKTEYKSWICAGCNEKIEGQFAVCWKCGGTEAKE